MIITGFANMILGFYFAANKSDDQRAENTRHAFQAIKATADAVASRPTGNPGDPVHVEEDR